MPRLREAVDQNTGEVYRIETTKQAKRRHQRSGGAQPKPTVGQINAADIWNKQEEKIRKDKEREERRRKAKQKQEEKDTRLRELQLEKLRAGRITIEDTWGKVNASQNRLHKFFGPPKSLGQNGSSFSKTDCRTSDRGPLTTVQPIVSYQDLDTFFTSSPLSPSNLNKPSDSSSYIKVQATELLQNTKLVFAQSNQYPLKRAAPSASQAMMPPPKRPDVSRDITEDDQVQTSVETGSTPSQSSTLRRPPSSERSTLGRVSASQINVRVNEQLDPISGTAFSDKSYFIGTQDVKNVLSGLCSQDFVDDFVEDEGKESNKSPSKSTHGSQRKIVVGNIGSTDMKVDTEEFDDEGLDDESLLSLAVTQRLRQDLLTSSKRRRESDLTTDPTTVTASQSTLVHSPAEKTLSSSTELKPGDSFAMDNLDDEDLIQGLENYESGLTRSNSEDSLFGIPCHTSNCKEEIQASGKGQGRVLPWVKNPISFSYKDKDDHETIATSPLSPWYDE